MTAEFPTVGKWFRRPNGVVFEVVAVDEQDATIEIQYFDGNIDEFDLESWPRMLPVEVHGPDDWTGSFDMDPDDYVGLGPNDMPPGFHDPLEFLEKKS